MVKSKQTGLMIDKTTAARYLGLSVYLVEQAVERGELTEHYEGVERRRRYNLDEVMEYKEAVDRAAACITEWMKRKKKHWN